MMELSVGYVRSVVMYRQRWRGTSFCRLGQKKGDFARGSAIIPDPFPCRIIHQAEPRAIQMIFHYICIERWYVPSVLFRYPAELVSK